ncbi:MAG TPA: TetR/AcrR family transcriptional regulator [Holophaga sp.]|nr:TetR/AcrR family transcriptional regulator [Holophaga sp.]HPS66291.1 TetR/AcrR family transcriptional regulator [Holophaga sp.]
MGKGAATRSRILDAAMKIASRDGLEGLTIGGLAKALSLSKSGLFVHFGSKEALQIAVLEHTLARFGEFAMPSVEAAAPGADKLRALFKAWLDWIDNPELPGGCPVLGAAFELDDREGAPREFLVSSQELNQRKLALAFRQAASPGADIDQLVFEMRAITLAYHYTSRVMRDPKAREKADKAFEELLRRAAS